METYNYSNLNIIITKQYSRIEKPQISQEDMQRQNIYNQFFNMYKNPNIENIGNGIKNLLFNNQIDIYDDRNTYTYISNQ